MPLPTSSETRTGTRRSRLSEKKRKKKTNLDARNRVIAHRRRDKCIYWIRRGQTGELSNSSGVTCGYARIFNGGKEKTQNPNLFSHFKEENGGGRKERVIINVTEDGKKTKKKKKKKTPAASS